MKKRIFSILLVCVLILAALPMTAFAKESSCTYLKQVKAPSDKAKLLLKLDGEKVGTFTFTENVTEEENDWNIQNSEKKYLAAEEGKLVLSDTEFPWTYEDSVFFMIEEPEQPEEEGKPVYLSTVKDGEELSDEPVRAELFKQISGKHNYKYVSCGDGTHDKICKKCGKTTNEKCVYDQKCGKCVCGAKKPTKVCVKIDVNVSHKHFGHTIWYTANICPKAFGGKIVKVEYSVNGGRTWRWGTHYMSHEPIERMKVRVLDSNGRWHYYAYHGKCPKQFIVTFNVDGIGASPRFQIVKAGAKVDKPEDPTAEGYVFEGWYKDKACTTEWDFDTDRVFGNTEIFAKWSKEQTMVDCYVYDDAKSNPQYVPVEGEQIVFVTSDGESYTGTTSEYGFARINVPTNAEGTWTITADGFETMTQGPVTYTEATGSAYFWLQTAVVPETYTITLSGENGHFTGITTGESSVSSVTVEEGKFFSNNSNGYFYIADDASGANVKVYQFVADEGYAFDGFTPAKGSYEEVTSSLTLTADTKQVVTVTFHAGTTEEISAGAAITGVGGNWNWSDSKAATCVVAADIADAAIIADFTANVGISNGDKVVGSWNRKGNDFYPIWTAEIVPVTLYVYGEDTEYAGIVGASVKFKTAEGDFTAASGTYGFTSLNVPKDVEGTWEISASGYWTKTEGPKTYTEAASNLAFWLDPVVPGTVRITLSGENGHFTGITTGESAVSSVTVEAGKFFSNNSNGYFYIADDAGGTNVKVYQFVPDEGYAFDGFTPSKGDYEEVTSSFTLTASAKQVVTVTFHAGTAEEISAGAAITGASGKWNRVGNTATCVVAADTADAAIIADFTANVSISNGDKVVSGWTRKVNDFYPTWTVETVPVYMYIYGNDTELGVVGANVKFMTAVGDFTATTGMYGFASIDVPKGVSGTWEISASGYQTLTDGPATFTAMDNTYFWLEPAAPGSVVISLSGANGHFTGITTGQGTVSSVYVEAGKFFSNNSNGYFYIADDASGTNVKVYQFVPDEGYMFDSFSPAKGSYEEVTSSFTLTANTKQTVMVTFHAGTAEQISAGAAITGAGGKWTRVGNTATCVVAADATIAAISADFTTNVSISYGDLVVDEWIRKENDFYPNWVSRMVNVSMNIYEKDSAYEGVSGASVKFKTSDGDFTATSDASGSASIDIPRGVSGTWEISATGYKTLTEGPKTYSETYNTTFFWLQLDAPKLSAEPLEELLPEEEIEPSEEEVIEEAEEEPAEEIESEEIESEEIESEEIEETEEPAEEKESEAEVIEEEEPKQEEIAEEAVSETTEEVSEKETESKEKAAAKEIESKQEAPAKEKSEPKQEVQSKETKAD